MPRRSALSTIAAAIPPASASPSARSPNGAATGPETPSANRTERGAPPGKRARAVTAKLSPMPAVRGPSQATSALCTPGPATTSNAQSRSSSPSKTSPPVHQAGASRPISSASGAIAAAARIARRVG